MLRLTILSLLFITASAFISDDGGDRYPVVGQNSFSHGEELEYKVNFGFISVGKAKMLIHDKTYMVNGRKCFKVDAFGETSGMVGWVAKVDDQWGAYIDKEALLPQMAYRKIKENSYRKDEVVSFDHKKDKLEVKVRDNKTGKYKAPRQYEAPTENTQDLLGGYLLLRTVDYTQKRVGDTISVSGFFEDSFYNMKIVFAGKERIKTKAGRFDALKLVPVVPDNKLFDGENSITVWLSDDDNKIPLKVKADMFIGNAAIELVSYKGLRNPPGRHGRG